jgi:hypothetical protein
LTVGVTAIAVSPLITASDDRKRSSKRRSCRRSIPKAYITPLASFRNFVKDEKDHTLFTVKGLPKDASRPARSA